MKIIEPSFTIETPLEWFKEATKLIERAGRTCYKSEGKITEDSDIQFIKHVCKRNHESVIEHFSVTVRIICDRGVTHELVRHRLCAFSQESTRYCSYDKDKFGNEITVIKPCFWDEFDPQYAIWHIACRQAEDRYFSLLQNGATPQEARSVLPNSLKTEIVMTANLREWKHIFKLRTDPAAHPQMRQIIQPLQEEFRKLIPVIFE